MKCMYPYKKKIQDYVCVCVYLLLLFSIFICMQAYAIIDPKFEGPSFWKMF